MLRRTKYGLLLTTLLAAPASANVITDWDEIATRTLQTSYGTTGEWRRCPACRMVGQ